MAHAAPAHPHRHGTQRPDDYGRRRPEETVLYQTIAEHWPAFSERLAAHGGLPRFIEHEFEAYLRCGILDFGFLEIACRVRPQRARRLQLQTARLLPLLSLAE